MLKRAEEGESYASESELLELLALARYVHGQSDM